MIDWVTAKMPCQNTLNTGFVAKVEPCGRIGVGFSIMVTCSRFT